MLPPASQLAMALPGLGQSKSVALFGVLLSKIKKTKDGAQRGSPKSLVVTVHLVEDGLERKPLLLDKRHRSTVQQEIDKENQSASKKEKHRCYFEEPDRSQSQK